MSTEHLRFMLAAITSEVGVSAFSEEFVWNPLYSKTRFNALISPSGRITVLDAVLRANLTDEERHRIFPTPLDLGRHERLEPSQRTYQAIANSVTKQLMLREDLDETYVKQTAVSIGKLAGFPFESYRERNPDLAARVLKLFVYLKKHHGSGVVGMLKSPGRPSLELTNPYLYGADNPKRRLFADIKSYLSAQIPPERLASIDACFACLRPELGRFIDVILQQIHNIPCSPGGEPPTMRDAYNRIQRGADIYKECLVKHTADLSKSILPLDEQLYVHLQSLDFLHYTEFMRQVREMQLIRPDVQPAVMHFRNSNVKAHSHDLERNPNAYMPMRPVVEYAFRDTIDPAQFKRAIVLGSHVLRHYFQGRMLDANAIAGFRLVAAALCFAMDLEAGRIPHFKPYIHGQSNISGSVLGAVLDKVNGRHEEFERICSESVDCYQAALIGQTELHDASRGLFVLFERTAAELCHSHDTERISTFLNALRTPDMERAWLDH